MDHAKAEQLRKTICGSCMVLAPVAFFASDLLWPVSHTKPAQMLRDVNGESGRTYAATVLAIAGMCLLAGAVVGLAHLLHERRPGMAFIGGALSMVGIVCASALVGAQGIFLAEAAKSGRDQVALTNLLDDMNDRILPIGVVTLVIGIGMVVLAVGLYRTRVAPVWAAICVGVAGVGFDVGNPVASKPVIFASELILFVGLGAIGLEVLGETQEEWEHTPEFHGFKRPVLA